MKEAVFGPGGRVRRYWAGSDGWFDKAGEVLGVGRRLTREEGFDLNAYAVRWLNDRESEEPEFPLAVADLVESGTHRFP